MKKIFALCLCAFLICATPILAYAESETSEPVEQETMASEDLTTTEEIATESEILAEVTVPDKIVNFIKENYEGSSFLSLAVTIVVYTFFAVKKHKSLSGSIGVLNNNAVKIANDSTSTINAVMSKADEMAEIVKGYKEAFETALSELCKSAEEKQSLEAMLSSVQKTLETSKMANKELADELAELLVLANIPPSKKEELYKRHRTAADAITAAENTEVITHDGKEA